MSKELEQKKYEKVLKEYNILQKSGINKSKVDIFSSESGDWYVVKLNGELFCEGHSISTYDIKNLLEKIGVEVNEKEVTNDFMESGAYL